MGQLTIEIYSEDALQSVSACNFLSESDMNSLSEMREELQDTFEKKQLWRTETEMRFSVLNDIKHPTKASKYWQAVKEQAVFFENLVSLSFDYRRNLIAIKRLQQQIDRTSEGLDREEMRITLEELLFKKKNQEIASKDRMRELKLWSKIKTELDDGSFNSENVDTHQAVSYGQRFLGEYAATVKMGATLDPAEARNLLGQTLTILKLCDEKGLLDQVVAVLPEVEREKILGSIGVKRIS